MATTPKPALLTLTFQRLDGSDPVQLQAEPDERVAKLGRRLAESLGVSLADKRPQFVRGGRVLEAGDTLEEAGIADGEELQLVWLPGTSDTWPINLRRRLQIEAKPGLDEAELAALLAEAKTGGVLDLAGRRGLGPMVPQLISGLPQDLRELDVRATLLSKDQLEEVFRHVPSNLKVLRAGGNELSVKALCTLARLPAPDDERPRRAPRAPTEVHLSGLAPRLRVLDLGFCDMDVQHQRRNRVRDALVACVGEETEDLDLSDLTVSSAALATIIEQCPNLRRLGVAWCFEDLCDRALEALAAHCPRLEVLEAAQTTCTSAGLNALLAGCRRLRVLSLGDAPAGEESATRDWTPLVQAMQAGLPLEVLGLKVNTLEEAKAVAPLPLAWLFLESGESNLEGSSPEALAETVGLVQAGSLHLKLRAMDSQVIRAAGAKLRGLESEENDPVPAGLLPKLAPVALATPRLQRLSINLWEQVSNADLVTVANSCPLLEVLHLNSEVDQVELLDEGVLAVGSCCHELRVLDMYHRALRDPVATLAAACAGWPELRYLCAANVGIEWEDQHIQVAESLAQNCPLLAELVIYDVPEAWKPVLSRGSPSPLCIFS